MSFTTHVFMGPNDCICTNGQKMPPPRTLNIHHEIFKKYVYYICHPLSPFNGNVISNLLHE